MIRIFTLMFIAVLNFGAPYEARGEVQDCVPLLEPFNGTRSAELLRSVKSVRQDLLKGYHLPANFRSGYFSRRIEPYLSKPSYQEVKKPAILYRGMYIDLDALEGILSKGMELKHVTWTAAGGGISFSSNINEAASYIFQSGIQQAGKVGVVFEVKMSDAMLLVDDPILNSTRTIFKKQSDVSADDITNVYIWGQWGLESLKEISEKAKQGKIVPHEAWTGVFDRGF